MLSVANRKGGGGGEVAAMQIGGLKGYRYNLQCLGGGIDRLRAPCRETESKHAHLVCALWPRC